MFFLELEGGLGNHVWSYEKREEGVLTHLNSVRLVLNGFEDFT